VNSHYELVPLKNGVFSIRLRSNGETFHPVIGPVAEAEALYVRQLKLRERAKDKFVIWDVGLGAGGNVLTAIRHLADLPITLHIISFDHTLEALRFALEHAGQLEFPAGFEEPIQQLLRDHTVTFQHSKLQVRWQVHVADFPALLAGSTKLPAPDAIFFDAYSPARNAVMWTLPLFECLFRRLDPQRPCTLATYTRSTIPRVTLLLAGFFVGAGDPVAGKEETTIASNSLALIEKPLAARWLERARTSHSAEPLRTDDYVIAPLTSATWEQLRAHPQFQQADLV
jgi:tRNA U34 5-methylaminomethyl-2-thiouridine-forming methyltransferase MnmC